MSIRCPEVSLRNIQRVPLVRIGCGYSTTLQEHNEALDQALVSNTYLYELRHELALLERTEQFFRRFPASKHRLKVTKTYRDRKELREIRDDPVFEDALRADPELYQFLTDHSSFLLLPRLSAVKDSIQQLHADLDVHLVTCPACKSGCLTIEHEFFQKL